MFHFNFRRLQTIIGELGHISPLLTPPRQPQKNDGHTLPVTINLNHLDSAQLLRIKNMFIKNAPAVSFCFCSFIFISQHYIIQIGYFRLVTLLLEVVLKRCRSS